MIKFISTRCAICHTEGNAAEIYPANFDPNALNSSLFSARRPPDKIHYRIVRCDSCGLVRSDPRVESEALERLYRESSFDYEEEIENLKTTYGRYLAKLELFKACKGSLLEIGCGNGFFLEEALKQGYATVRGIEPSLAASEKARPEIRPSITPSPFRPRIFNSEQFDVICLFQVLDHIPEPATFVEECFKILKRGGLVLAINHNIEALSARLLKERSPIIDIEHTYLYSPMTMARLFGSPGFDIKLQGFVSNTYSLHYLTRLLPLPVSLKQGILDSLKRVSIGRIRLKLPLGNLFLVAEKPNR